MRERINGGRCRHRQAGVGLIEVLIAVLVLAVGVLGIMSLQINGKRVNFQAMQRSSGAPLAQEMLERIRGNPGDLSLYAATVGGATITSAPSPDCSSATCTVGAQLAAYDLWEWEQRLDAAASGLVNPTGCITVTGRYVAVSVVWESTVELDQTGSGGCGDGKYGTDDKRRQEVTMSSYFAE